ncbi:MAG: myxosortase-dependent metalloprotease, MXAN_2677/MXAN_2678 family [Myxococcales bacterium]
MTVFLAVLLAFETHLALDGQVERWSFAGDGLVTVRLIDPPAGLRLKPGGDLRAALTMAAQAWQAIETAHVPVRYLGQIHPRDPLPGEILFDFDTGSGFPGGRDAAGSTEIFVSGHSIVSARIHLNAADFDWATDGSTSALDVQSIAEHEMGHALGLAHPCGDLDTQTPSCSALPAATFQALQQDVMFPSIAPGPRRAPSQDDRDGLTFLLPAAVSPEIAPELTGLLPSCLELDDRLDEDDRILTGQDVVVEVDRAPDASVLELLSADSVIERTTLVRDGKGRLLAAVGSDILHSVRRLDARLVAASGKANVLFGALDVAKSCSAHGCSSSGASVLALAPLAWLAFRKSKSAPRRRGERGGFFSKKSFSPRPLRLRGALVAAACLCAGPALAYKRSVNAGNVCIWWSTRGHPFQIDAQGTPDVPAAQAFTAIRKSFQTWADVGCSDLAFPDQGLSLDPKNRVVGYFPGQYNRNLVLWRTRRCGNGKNGGVVPPGDSCLGVQSGCANAYDCWDHGDGVIATTTTTSNRFTGQINDTDIEINDSVGTDGTKFIFTAVDGLPCVDQNQTGCVRIDIQNTITHEAGHTLGLDHTADPNATMYATAPEGETSKRVLGSDDIQGICDVYPRGARTVTCNSDPITLTESGTSNGGCGCSHAHAGPGATLLALAAFLLSRRRPKPVIITSSAAASASLRDIDHRS